MDFSLLPSDVFRNILQYLSIPQVIFAFFVTQIPPKLGQLRRTATHWNAIISSSDRVWEAAFKRTYWTDSNSTQGDGSSLTWMQKCISEQRQELNLKKGLCVAKVVHDTVINAGVIIEMPTVAQNGEYISVGLIERDLGDMMPTIEPKGSADYDILREISFKANDFMIAKDAVWMGEYLLQSKRSKSNDGTSTTVLEVYNKKPGEKPTLLRTESFEGAYSIRYADKKKNRIVLATYQRIFNLDSESRTTTFILYDFIQKEIVSTYPTSLQIETDINQSYHGSIGIFDMLPKLTVLDLETKEILWQKKVRKYDRVGSLSSDGIVVAWIHNRESSVVAHRVADFEHIITFPISSKPVDSYITVLNSRFYVGEYYNLCIYNSRGEILCKVQGGWLNYTRDLTQVANKFLFSSDECLVTLNFDIPNTPRTVIEIGATAKKVDDLKEVQISSEGALMAQMSNRWKVEVDRLFSRIIFETSSTRIHLLVYKDDPKIKNPTRNRIANLLLKYKSKERRNYYVGAKVSNELGANDESDYLGAPNATELKEVFGHAALIKEVKQADGQWLMSDYTLKELKHQIQIGEFAVPPPSVLSNIISTFRK